MKEQDTRFRVLGFRVLGLEAKRLPEWFRVPGKRNTTGIPSSVP